MERFRVSLNGSEKVIGISEPGVVSVTAMAVVRQGEHSGPLRECSLNLGGLNTSNMTDVRWGDFPLIPGDSITIEVLCDGDSESGDEGAPLDPELLAEREKSYLRNLAEKFGWKIIESEGSES